MDSPRRGRAKRGANYKSDQKRLFMRDLCNTTTSPPTGGAVTPRYNNGVAQCEAQDKIEEIHLKVTSISNAVTIIDGTVQEPQGRQLLG